MLRALSDRGVRAWLWQAAALIGVIAAGLYLGHNLIDNLARRGITTGFSFLGTEAGFGVSFSLIPYSEASSYARVFAVGLMNTILVSALGIVAATVIGFLVGIGRLSSNWLVAKLSTAYVEIIRNVPLLLQIFFFYFAVLQALPSPSGSFAFAGAIFLNNRGLFVPGIAEGGLALLLAVLIAIGLGVIAVRGRGRVFRAGVGLAAFVVLLIGLSFVEWDVPALRGFNYRGGLILIPELVALWGALSIYTAAFIAEVVRGGIQAVPRGQIEAAMALGLSRPQVLWHVVVPIAMRVIIPPLTNQYLNLTKNSSLATAIAYPDLVAVFAGTVLNQTGQAVEVIAITMAVYLTLSLSIAFGMNLYNRRVAMKGS